MNKYCFGIDIGGTTIKCGLFTQEGQLVYKTQIPTRTQIGPKPVFQDIADCVMGILKEQQMDAQDVLGIGLGVPGSVRSDGMVDKCINLGWDVFYAKELMEGIVPFPVHAGNDANMAALGEYWQGGSKEYADSMLITIGTGVGGGVILGGRPLYGCFGAAGEIGHLPIIDDETEHCNCGKIGCLEQRASATGIVRTAKRLLKSSQAESVLRNRTEITSKDIFEAAQAGDALAEEVVECIAQAIAKGLACAAGIIDPECFVIGGGVSAAGEYLREKIERYYQQLVFHPSKNTNIRLATLGNDAGMYGAAKLVLIS